MKHENKIYGARRISFCNVIYIRMPLCKPFFPMRLPYVDHFSFFIWFELKIPHDKNVLKKEEGGIVEELFHILIVLNVGVHKAMVYSPFICYNYTPRKTLFKLWSSYFYRILLTRKFTQQQMVMQIFNSVNHTLLNILHFPSESYMVPRTHINQHHNNNFC